MTIKGKSTKADEEALKLLPDSEWFSLRKVPWQVRNPRYRCDRLTELGLLERRVVTNYPDIDTQWRKLPRVEQPIR